MSRQQRTPLGVAGLIVPLYVACCLFSSAQAQSSTAPSPSPSPASISAWSGSISTGYLGTCRKSHPSSSTPPHSGRIRPRLCTRIVHVLHVLLHTLVGFAPHWYGTRCAIVQCALRRTQAHARMTPRLRDRTTTNLHRRQVSRGICQGLVAKHTQGRHRCWSFSPIVPLPARVLPMSSCRRS